MVCNRCKLVVSDELAKLKYNIQSVNLGEVELSDDLHHDELQSIDNKYKRIWL